MGQEGCASLQPQLSAGPPGWRLAGRPVGTRRANKVEPSGPSAILQVWGGAADLDVIDTGKVTRVLDGIDTGNEAG